MCDASFAEYGIIRVGAMQRYPIRETAPAGCAVGPKNPDCRHVPRFAPYIGAGFVFAHARFVKEVPFDPYLPFIFMGEELNFGARAFTHGWDIFCPSPCGAGFCSGGGWLADARQGCVEGAYKSPPRPDARRGRVEDLKSYGNTGRARSSRTRTCASRSPSSGARCSAPSAPARTTRCRSSCCRASSTWSATPRPRRRGGRDAAREMDFRALFGKAKRAGGTAPSESASVARARHSSSGLVGASSVPRRAPCSFIARIDRTRAEASPTRAGRT